MTAIEKIEALKVTDPIKGRELANFKLDQAIDILRAETVIKAKALHQIGTNNYYYPDDAEGGWFVSGIPRPYFDKEIPDGCELVDIQIHVPE